MNGSPLHSAAGKLIVALVPALAACSMLPSDPAFNIGGFAAVTESSPHLSMKTNGSGLMISYQDSRSNALMLASCRLDCAKPDSNWQVTPIRDAGAAGVYTSLSLDGDRLSIGYHDFLSGNLKLATCVGACTSRSSTWQISTVDKGEFAGPYTTVGFSAGKSFISYYDQNRQALKLASCVEDCFSVSPRWQISTIDSGEGGIGTPPSLQLRQGVPVVSYYKHKLGALKLATCLDRCTTSNPDWRIVTVDASGDVGESASLQLNGDKPVISYRDVQRGTVKLATCVEGCTSDAPAWHISTLDAKSHARGFTSLQLRNGKPVIGFYDAAATSLDIAICESGCETASPVWTKLNMGRGRFAGTQTSLQLSSDRAAIGYYDLNTGRILYSVAGIPRGDVVSPSQIVMN